MATRRGDNNRATTRGTAICGVPDCGLPCYERDGIVHGYCGKFHAIASKRQLASLYSLCPPDSTTSTSSEVSTVIRYISNSFFVCGNTISKAS